jgi:two-component system, LuxR family, sensor histidine kinase DctS
VRSRQRSREAVPVATLFEAVSPLLQLQARKLNLALVMDVAPDCPAVWCDRTMVEQVLLNLARNGMQAMAAHEPCRAELRRLRLAAQPATTESGMPGWVAFSVSDHGPGLSPAQAEHLFTPFFTTKAEGMGLGLNLCRTVVEQHGGALTHHAHTPFGTVFSFTLPAHNAL